MTLTLELKPEEVTALSRRARADGVDIEAVLHRLIASLTLPPAPVQARREEDAADDPEEQAERDREREEVQANINRWRAEEGRPPAHN